MMTSNDILKILEPPKVIDSFTGEYRFLSNFWPCKIDLHTEVYPSVEHAYVAMKSDDPKIRKQVSEIETAGQVKRFGRTIPLRDNWDANKYQIMVGLLFVKFFQNKELGEKLLATGDAILIEGNTWGDTYWGVCNGVGENNLGKILMEVRNLLKGVRSE
jgi:N-glycosidase YbiA